MRKKLNKDKSFRLSFRFPGILTLLLLALPIKPEEAGLIKHIPFTSSSYAGKAKQNYLNCFIKYMCLNSLSVLLDYLAPPLTYSPVDAVKRALFNERDHAPNSPSQWGGNPSKFRNTDSLTVTRQESSESHTSATKQATPRSSVPTASYNSIGGHRPPMAPQKAYLSTMEPLEFQRLLDELSQIAEDKKMILALAFDIDGTIFTSKRYLSDLTTDQEKIFLTWQSEILSIFQTWLESGTGRKRILLIYNTARYYQKENWLEDLRDSRLPQPHLLIHRNGQDIQSSGRKPEVLSQINEETHAIAQISETLSNALKMNDYIAKKNLTTDSCGETHGTFSFFFQQKDYQFCHNYFGFTPTSAHIYFSAPDDLEESDESLFHDASQCLLSVCQLTDNFKACLNQTRNASIDTFLYDETVNKGTALALLMALIKRHIPAGESLHLFISGDDIYDIPALFFNWLSLAFMPAIDRSEDHLREILDIMGVSEKEWEYTKKLWVMSILPVMTTTDHFHMEQTLKTLGAYRESQYLKFSETIGLPGLMSKVLESMR